jgi:hypothetical protein
MIKYMENFLCSSLTKHVACCVFISIATYNLNINMHHFRRDKSKQFFLRKDSGHLQIKIVFLVVACIRNQESNNRQFYVFEAQAPQTTPISLSPHFF